MARVKVTVGDVFQIPIDASRVGYGQVVLQPENNVLFICVFAATTPPDETPDLQQIVRSEILLAGSTFDAKFNHGHWPIVGRVTENLTTIELPVYKYGKDDETMLESLDRSRQRRATKEEASSLPFRTYTAPVGFELALKAIAGVGEWLGAFDDLKYDQLRKSNEIVI
jgi:Immunity protein 26